jgi:hypothetical protein
LLAVLNAAPRPEAVATEVNALLTILQSQAPHLRSLRLIGQPGYVLDRLAMQAAELGDDRLERVS